MDDSLYDHEKAMAFQTMVIQLAAVNELSMMEMYEALNPVVAVCKSTIMTQLKEAGDRAKAEERRKKKREYQREYRKRKKSE